MNAATLKIKKWLSEHPLFKVAGMCAEVGIDKSNFQRILKSDADIPEKILDKILPVIKQYGFFIDLETYEQTSAGKPLRDFATRNNQFPQTDGNKVKSVKMDEAMLWPEPDEQKNEKPLSRVEQMKRFRK